MPRNWRDRDFGNARGGAEHLARIHGTEEDKVNCPFYYKIGACRHGEKCSRQHHKPPFSQTILIHHMYRNPVAQLVINGADPTILDQKQVQSEFDDFYEEVYEELSKHGRIEELNICDNLGEHLVGNVYVKFSDEEEADNALRSLFGRYYAGKQLTCEFSPVTDFKEARCRQFDDGLCSRGGFCNFMHVKDISRSLQKDMEKRLRRDDDRHHRHRRRSDSRNRKRRSNSKKRRHRSKSRSRSRSGSKNHRRKSKSHSKQKDSHSSRKERRHHRSESQLKSNGDDNNNNNKLSSQQNSSDENRKIESPDTNGNENIN